MIRFDLQTRSNVCAVVALFDYDVGLIKRTLLSAAADERSLPQNTVTGVSTTVLLLTSRRSHQVDSTRLDST